jgi:hypothetical protein
MVKARIILATRLLSTNGHLVCNLTRIRGGFLPRENIEQAKRYLAEIQDTLREIEEDLAVSSSSSLAQTRSLSLPSSPLAV